jgi:hypothetical protein
MNLKIKNKILILLLFPFTLWAQEVKQTSYPFNQLRFSVTPTLCSSLNVSNTGANNIFNSNPSFGGEITASYYQRIVKGFGVSLGIGINSTPYSFNFSFIPNVSDPENSYYQKEIKVKRYEPMGMITIPLALSMILPIKSSSWSIDIHAGAKLNYLFNSGDRKLFYESDIPFSEIQHSNVDAIKENSFYWIESKINKRFLFSYFLKVGASYTTKRNDCLFFNIVANYSPQKALTANYMIHAIDGDSFGNYKQNLNFLGLEVGYALSLCKKR